MASNAAIASGDNLYFVLVITFVILSHCSKTYVDSPLQHTGWLEIALFKKRKITLYFAVITFVCQASAGVYFCGNGIEKKTKQMVKE